MADKNLYHDGMHFKKGNPGRPKGTKSKTTLRARQMLGANSEAIMQKTIAEALAGDKQMLRFLAGKLLGKMSSGIKVTGSSPAAMLRSILKQVNSGHSAGDAAPMVEIIKALTAALELEDIEARLEKLENAKP